MSFSEINPPTRNKRSRAERERDLDKVADFYLRGFSQQAIAEELGRGYAFTLTRQQIAYDLVKVRERWLSLSTRNFSEAKAEQLAKIDRLEAEYLAGWERSCSKRKTTMTEKFTNGKARAQMREQEMVGDPRFLAGAQKCVEQRCLLLGLNAPLKIGMVTKTWMDILKERHQEEQKILKAAEDQSSESTVH